MSDEEDAFSFEQHMEEVKSIFLDVARRNGAPNDGVDYKQFQTILETTFYITFETEEELQDYCRNLDPRNTQSIQFEDFYNMLCKDQKEQEELANPGSTLRGTEEVE